MKALHIHRQSQQNNMAYRPTIAGGGTASVPIGTLVMDGNRDHKEKLCLIPSLLSQISTIGY